MLRTIMNSAVLMCLSGLLLIISPGCKKNTTATTPNLAGTWRNLDTASSIVKYLVLRSDLSAYSLGAAVYNLHVKESMPYVVENDKLTIAIGGGNATVYSYTISNDTLYLNSPGSTARFKKDADQNPATWVKDIQLSEISSAGNGYWFGPMDYTGTGYVTAGFYTKRIYSINAANTLQIDSTGAMPGAMSGIVHIGSDTWIATPALDNKLRKIDLSTSAVIQLSSAAPGAVMMMAKNGNNILVLAAPGIFYNYDPVADNFTQVASIANFFSSGSLPTGYIDIECKDNKVYMTYINLLLEFDLATGQFSQTYNLLSSAGSSGSGTCIGLCYDGSSFVTQRISQGFTTGNFHVDIAKFNLQ